jgi:hypothetical protein
LSPAEQEILEQLTVRLIRPQERARFDELIIQEHYLHSAELVLTCAIKRQYIIWGACHELHLKLPVVRRTGKP